MSKDLIDSYREVLGKVEGLQRGFTTGTAVQGAAKAAALMLLSKKKISEIDIELKNKKILTLPVVNASFSMDSAECGIIKDSGDDEDDITHGHEFRAKVIIIDTKEIVITAGEGIGRVTKEGLPVKIGEWAINHNPRNMIKKSLIPLMPERGGFKVELSVPDGVQLASETWNPRLGIVGGISILGTSGIVEPKSSKAYTASIAISLHVARVEDSSVIFLVFGYVGEAFVKKHYKAGDERIIKFGDHAGFTLKTAGRMGFEKIILVGHIGKMSKLASGIFNTHSKYGDARLETLAAYAGASGLAPEKIKLLLKMKMAERGASFLVEEGALAAFELLNDSIIERSLYLIKKPVTLNSVILNLRGDILSDSTGYGGSEDE